MKNLRVRFHDDLHEALKASAKASHRSLNSEILHRLCSTYGPEGVAYAAQSKLLEKEILKIARDTMKEVTQTVLKGYR